MKKILSVFAAAAVLFGFASCSGDLHDLKAAPLGVLGIGVDGDNNYAIPMEMISDDGSEQSLKFTWSSGTDGLLTATDGKNYGVKDGWGKAAGNLSIGIALPTAVTSGDKPISDWTKVRRGDADPFFLTIGDEEYKTLLSSAKAFPENIQITGLVDGEEYILYAKYDSSAEMVSLRITGKTSDPTQFRIISTTSKNFPEKVEKKDADGNIIKDKDGNPLYEYPVYAMSQAGDDYTYQFIAKETESTTIAIKNDLIGTMAEDTALDVKKNHEYKITFTKKAGETGVYKIEEIDFLKNAEFLTNSNHNYDFYNENIFSWLAPYSRILFKAPAEKFDLKVRRISGDSSKVWAKDSSNITIKNTPIKLKYYTITKTDEESKVNPVTISGLEKDKYYWLDFEIDENTSLSITLKDAELSKPEQICGPFPGAPIDLNYDTDNKCDIEFTLADPWNDGWNSSNSKTISFAILAKKNIWDPKGTVYKNAEINLDGESVVIPPSTTGGNNHIVSSDDLGGKKIKITIISDYCGIKVKAITVK